MKKEYGQHTYPKYPDTGRHPFLLLKQHNEREYQHQSAQDQVTDLTVAEYIHLIILQFRLYLFRRDIQCFVFSLLVGSDHIDYFIRLLPVAGLQSILHFGQVPVEDTGYEQRIFA